MNYAYIIYSGDFSLSLECMLKTLDKHCDCIMLANIFGITDEFSERLSNNFSKRIIYYDIHSNEWTNKIMFCKINRLKKMNFKYGDNIFVMDTDLIVQDNIYEVFEQDFDICYTSRHYNYWYQINAGFWGFKFNKRSEQFINFYIEQMERPTWGPFVDFQKRFNNHVGNLNWWCDQDFLCTVYENKDRLPFECKILDLGYRYNFCPSVENNIPGTFELASKEIMKQFGNKEYKILHFKGRLKEIMNRLEV
jgi:hypothetical protein